MKKGVFLLLALFCAFSVYSSTREIGIKINPYALQIVTKSDAEDPVISTGGFGVETYTKKYVNKGFFVEGVLSWNRYELPDGKSDFNSVLAFAGIGDTWRISDVFSLTADVAFGADTQIYPDTSTDDVLTAQTVTLRAGLGCSFNFDERFALVVGCNGTFGFAKDDTSEYVNYRVLPYAGASITF